MLTLYRAARPTAALVLAHGAGAGQTSPFMVRVAQGLADRGISTATFDFPYMTAKRHMPDKPPVLEEAWRHAIEEATRTFAALPLFIGGKSMGGRIATHVAAAPNPTKGVRGIVLLGYPLHPPGRPQQRRDAHLPAIDVPMLFVQGSRDTFGTGADITAILPSLRHATLHEVAGGDHSFKTSGKKDSLEPIMDTVAEWIRTKS
jgi:predicted alpha/beta-hydrolase family hydrolase